MKNEAMNRKLKISILRFNPQEPGSVPRMQTYEIDEAENMTLFIALMEIREKQDPSLRVRLRLPRRHLRQLRHDDQRPSDPCLPYVDERLGHRDLTGAPAGLRADCGLVGGYRQMDARYERAIWRPGFT